MIGWMVEMEGEEYLKKLRKARLEKPFRWVCPFCGSDRVYLVVGSDVVLCRDCGRSFKREDLRLVV